MQKSRVIHSKDGSEAFWDVDPNPLKLLDAPTLVDLSRPLWVGLVIGRFRFPRGLPIGLEINGP